MTRASACWRCASAVKRHVLRGIRNRQDHARILHREKSFGHDHIQKQGENQRPDGDQQGDRSDARRTNFSVRP